MRTAMPPASATNVTDWPLYRLMPPLLIVRNALAGDGPLARTHGDGRVIQEPWRQLWKYRALYFKVCGLDVPA